MMNNKERILQANLNNQGGAFSVAYEAQKELQNEYIFDYFFPDEFVQNDVYRHLVSMGSKCVGALKGKNRFIKQYAIYRSFYNYLCANDYNTVHIHSDTAWKISVYYLAAKKAKVDRIIVHSHSSGINGHYKRLNYFLHKVTKEIIKTARYKCACSKIAADWMFDNTENVAIIRNGVEVEKFKFNPKIRKEIREKFDISDQVVIGSVSDFSYQKNPEFIYELIKAFKDNPKYIFLFVGNRYNACNLKELIDDDKDINNVIFVGEVTNVQDYLCAMDIFVLPSRFEGLPMCALEAQVSGLYTIISEKVTDETECSTYFSRLKLDVIQWKNFIENLNLLYDRNDRSKFLDFDKTSSSNMAKEFKRLYMDEK